MTPKLLWRRLRLLLLLLLLPALLLWMLVLLQLMMLTWVLAPMGLKLLLLPCCTDVTERCAAQW